jgi:hypothetical protein
MNKDKTKNNALPELSEATRTTIVNWISELVENCYSSSDYKKERKKMAQVVENLIPGSGYVVTDYDYNDG